MLGAVPFPRSPRPAPKLLCLAPEVGLCPKQPGHEEDPDMGMKVSTGAGWLHCGRLLFSGTWVSDALSLPKSPLSSPVYSSSAESCFIPPPGEFSSAPRLEQGQSSVRGVPCPALRGGKERLPLGRDCVCCGRGNSTSKEFSAWSLVRGSSLHCPARLLCCVAARTEQDPSASCSVGRRRATPRRCR